MNQKLQPDSTLQGGKYRIVRSLGQGGFGITYLAIQSGLERKVAVKEFFMKDFCWRDSATRQVMLSTEGHRELVSRYHAKFLKEARRTAQFVHPHIVRIIDVFQENYTAYYVMEFAGRGSLQDKVEREGALPEAEATRYILQVASALDYVHRQKVNHLDVKPGNIMLNDQDEAVLIDFGLAKQYEASTGGQTSTTPIGYSHGYAPSEQYRDGGVSKFSPETDIYSLGATFFFLLTGQRPPSASDVIEDGVPVDVLKSKRVSPRAIAAICRAMKERRKDRYRQVRDFMEALGGAAPFVSKSVSPVDTVESLQANGTTLPISEGKPQVELHGAQKQDPLWQRLRADLLSQWSSRKVRVSVAVALVVVLGILLVLSRFLSGGIISSAMLDTDTLLMDSAAVEPNAVYANGVLTVDDVTYQMIKVKGGTFMMGATAEMQYPENDEKPAHQVTLDSYSIGETEVTQALWQAVMGNNPSHFEGDNLPVENVSWKDCQSFVGRLNGLTGQHFRLPTEAEWEYAARGGSSSHRTQFSGSSDLSEVAWYDENSDDKTHPVKSKKANRLGIYDMAGNVWEWCSDRYDSYSDNEQTNPVGATSGSNRVRRGGSWGSHIRRCHSSCRNHCAPGYRDSYIGLRLALSE